MFCVLIACTTAGAAKKKSAKKNVAPIAVANLRTERMVNPMSIDTPTPRLGWQIVSAKQDVMQTSYHIIVASTREKAQNMEGDLWDADVSSDQSQWIEYAGKELRSNTRCYWRVKVNTTQGASDWSDVAMPARKSVRSLTLSILISCEAEEIMTVIISASAPKTMI